MVKGSYEQWKIVPGFDDVYLISSCGRVWVRECARVLSNGLTRVFKARFIRSDPQRGYPWVMLCHPQTRARRNVHVHLLVAEAFLGEKPSPTHEANHNDGNKKNPDVSNLEWVTPNENMLHAYRTGLHDNERAVYLEYGGEKMRAIDWARRTGISPQTVYGRINRGYETTAILDVSGAAIEKIRRQKISKGHLKRRSKYKDGLRSKVWAQKLGISQAAFLWRVKHYPNRVDLIYHIGTFSRSGPNEQD